MSLTKCEVNTNNIENLADAPALSASELKKCFDKAGKDIKDYLNNILIEELQNELSKIKSDYNNMSTTIASFESRIKKLEDNSGGSSGGNQGETTLKLGDVNGDGVIDGTDAELVLKHYSGEITLTGEQLKRADVNGDGEVTPQDAALIRQMISDQ